MAAKATDYTQFDLIEDVRRDIEKSVGDLPSLDSAERCQPDCRAHNPRTCRQRNRQRRDRCGLRRRLSRPPQRRGRARAGRC
jgi:hypothetical protein